ncbi:MAG: hypothetical protein M5U27_16270 [Gaiella sp.]|nr:hypothetical protein [Gaiella sp.]
MTQHQREPGQDHDRADELDGCHTSAERAHRLEEREQRHEHDPDHEARERKAGEHEHCGADERQRRARAGRHADHQPGDGRSDDTKRSAQRRPLHP